MKVLSRISSPLGGIAVLILFWLLLVASIWNKSLTYDELVHAPAGYSYWKHNDYRLNPENGNLPQRIAGLGYLGDEFPLPPTSAAAWRSPEQWEFGELWFHRMGHDVPAMLHRGRMVAALQAVGLAALVWLWSRRLFGPVGGMVSLTLCALSPAILANGPLVTSDTAAALFFLAATWSVWSLLHRLTPSRLLVCAAAVGGLFVSKSSALLIVPIALVLVLARLIEGSPLPAGVRARWTIAGRARQLAAFAVAGTAVAAAVFVVIWAFYGFRYSAFAPGSPSQAGSRPLWEGTIGERSLPEMVEDLALPQPVRDRARQVLEARTVPSYGWDSTSSAAHAELKTSVLSPAQVAQLDAIIAAARPPALLRTVQFLARHEVLPEAFLLGTAHAWRFAQMRSAFFSGQFSRYGSGWFFPFSFAVKTPLALFAIAGLAAAAAFAARAAGARGTPAAPGGDAAASGWKGAFYRTLPLWTLLGLYWFAALSSRLNIGHRHILATYPPLFILCGAAAGLLAARPSRGPLRYGAAALAVLLGIHGLETAWRFPDYISYFNGLIPPSRGYRHFVDSTIDWGQDLPGVRRHIQENPSAGPYYLSYFGNDDPRSHGVAGANVRYLPSNPGRFLRGREPILFIPLAAATPEALAQFARDLPEYNYIGIGTLGSERTAVLIRKPEAWRLGAGTYFISATNLQVGWTDKDEAAYQEYRSVVRPFIAPGPDDAAQLRQRSMADWRRVLEGYEHIRQARLAAYLRPYTPDDHVGHSILVYKVTAADIERALEGPKPEFRYLNRRLGESAR